MAETAKVATAHGPIEVEARPTNVPGLIITRSIHQDDTGAFKPRRAWIITHEPSGYAVTTRPFDRLSDALACATRFGEITDWTRSADELNTNADPIRDLIHNAIRSTEHDRLGEEIAKLRRTLS